MESIAVAARPQASDGVPLVTVIAISCGAECEVARSARYILAMKSACPSNASTFCGSAPERPAQARSGHDDREVRVALLEQGEQLGELGAIALDHDRARSEQLADVGVFQHD